jgi:endonuclease I
MLEWQLKRLKELSLKLENNIILSTEAKEEWEELTQIYENENKFTCWKHENMNNIKEV